MKFTSQAGPLPFFHSWKVYSLCSLAKWSPQHTAVQSQFLELPLHWVCGSVLTPIIEHSHGIFILAFDHESGSFQSFVSDHVSSSKVINTIFPSVHNVLDTFSSNLWARLLFKFIWPCGHHTAKSSSCCPFKISGVLCFFCISMFWKSLHLKLDVETIATCLLCFSIWNQFYTRFGSNSHLYLKHTK